MTAALVGGLVKTHPAANIYIADRNDGKRTHLHTKFGVTTVTAQADLPANIDLLVLSVKPTDMQPVCEQAQAATIVSVAAGLRLANMEQWFSSPPTMLVRAMPNTPAAVGYGMTACYARPPATTSTLVNSLFSAVGDVVWTENESLLDTITAISGSGPAYIYYFLEALEEAAIVMGIPPQMARRLAIQTLRGGGEMARLTETTPAELRHAVALKGGVTERAINVMEEKQLKKIIKTAIQSARTRAQQIGDELQSKDN